MQCPDIDALVESKIDRVATQYRESPKLLGLIRAYLRPAAEAYDALCETLDKFDIDNAVGDQLTILGKALGWPRTHCKGQKRPVFGFSCEGFDECSIPVRPVAGFCFAEWNCDGPDFVEFTFRDDELYRGFLKARVVTLLGDYTRKGLTEAARAMFGQDAVIYRERPAVVSVATGRLMTNVEISIVHLYAQVLPVAPGLRLELWHSKGRPFGFGAGWGGFCSGRFPRQIPLN
ncbi:MAG TPA: DUF2612 domain-containing protein [Ramlibacter sp.]|jgi:hypothetical protein